MKPIIQDGFRVDEDFVFGLCFGIATKPLCRLGRPNPVAALVHHQLAASLLWALMPWVMCE